MNQYEATGDALQPLFVFMKALHAGDVDIDDLPAEVGDAVAAVAQAVYVPQARVAEQRLADWISATSLRVADAHDRRARLAEFTAAVELAEKALDALEARHEVARSTPLVKIRPAAVRAAIDDGRHALLVAQGRLENHHGPIATDAWPDHLREGRRRIDAVAAFRTTTEMRTT